MARRSTSVTMNASRRFELVRRRFFSRCRKPVVRRRQLHTVANRAKPLAPVPEAPHARCVRKWHRRCVRWWSAAFDTSSAARTASQSSATTTAFSRMSAAAATRRHRPRYWRQTRCSSTEQATTSAARRARRRSVLHTSATCRANGAARYDPTSTWWNGWRAEGR